MSLVFKTIQTEGIAELSYLLGDDDEGTAAIFDPRPDVDVYIDMAREAKVAITHIFETHIHADLVSGSRELQSRLDSANIYVSHEGGANLWRDVGNSPTHTGSHTGTCRLHPRGSGSPGDTMGRSDWRFAFCFIGRTAGFVRGRSYGRVGRATI